MDRDGADVPADDAPPLRLLTVVLLGIGVLAIPVGLIFFYLAITKGEPSPRPAAGQGVVGIDAPVRATQLEGQWSLLQGGGSQLNVDLAGAPGDSATTQGVHLHTPSVEAGLLVRNQKLQTLVAQADLRQLTGDRGVAAEDAVSGRRSLGTDAFPLVRLRFEQPVDLPDSVGTETPTTLTLDGEVTLHGVTAPAKLETTLSTQRDEQLLLRFTGTIHLDLRDFGLGNTTGDGSTADAWAADLHVSFQLAQHTTPVTISRDITTGTSPGTSRPPGTR